MMLLKFDPFASIKGAFYGLMLLLDGAIYSLIGSAYRIFMAVASARILSSDAYTGIANKVYIIIGVVMLFILAYAILKAIIDPDQATKGKLSAPTIIKKIVIAVLGLALAPFLFNLLYQGQSKFIENDVITRLFFRTTVEEKNVGVIEVDNGDGTSTGYNIGKVNPNDAIKDKGGALTAAYVWQAFFYPDGVDASEIKVSPSELYLKATGLGVGATVAAVGGVAAFAAVAAGVGSANIWNPVGWVCLGVAAVTGIAAAITASTADELSSLTNGKDFTLEEAYAYASTYGNFYIFYAFTKCIVEDDTINYMFIISSIAGGFVLYVFISFTIDMGVRAAKLAYLQIIAPIPLILSILPEFDNNFNQYVKDVIRTFVEVFIRISVVYICIYIICHLTDLFSNTEKLWGNRDLSTIEVCLAIAALILGLIAFMKKAPNLIGEAFGMKEKMSLGLKSKLKEGGLFTAGAIVGGGVAGLTNSLSSLRNSDRWQNNKVLSKDGDKTRINWGNLAGRAGMVVGASARGVTRGAARPAWNRVKSGEVESGSAMIEAIRKSGENVHDKEKQKQENVDKRSKSTNKLLTDPDYSVTDWAKDQYDNSPLSSRLDKQKRFWFGTEDLKGQQDYLRSLENAAKAKDKARAATNTKWNEIQDAVDNMDERIKNASFEAAMEAGTVKKSLEKGGLSRLLRELESKGALDLGGEFDYRKLSEAKQYSVLSYLTDPAHTKVFTDEDREELKSDYLFDLRETRKKYNDTLETLRDFAAVDSLYKRGGKAMNAITEIMSDAYLWRQNRTEVITVELGKKFNEESNKWVDGEKVEMTIEDYITSFLGEGAIDGKVDPEKIARTLSSHDRVYVVDRDGKAFQYTHTVDESGKVHYQEFDKDGNATSRKIDSDEDMARILRTARVVENFTGFNIFANTARDNQGTVRASIGEKQNRSRPKDKA